MLYLKHEQKTSILEKTKKKIGVLNEYINAEILNVGEDVMR